MDPISAIVGALAAGATAAVSNVASKEIKDAYDALKELIATRFRRKAAVDMVEEAPHSPAAQLALGSALREVDAGADPDVHRLAEVLVAALRRIGSEELQRIDLTIGDVDGYRDAIVRGLTASGHVSVGNVIARGGDAIVSNISAGHATKKKT